MNARFSSLLVLLLASLGAAVAKTGEQGATQPKKAEGVRELKAQQVELDLEKLVARRPRTSMS